MATTKRVRFALSEEQEKRQQARDNETSYLKTLIDEALATAPAYQHSEYQSILQPALADYLAKQMLNIGWLIKH